MFLPFAFLALFAALIQKEQNRHSHQEQLAKESLSRQARKVLNQDYWDDARQDRL